MYTPKIKKKKEVEKMTNRNNTVPTRFTTGKARLTYAFLWTPRSASEDSDDQKGKKYSASVLIPKTDQQTIERFNIAFQHAVALGQQKGFWGASLPSSFKFPLRDGDAECAEKGEEYAGHWFLNASAVRQPQIVDINRNDIWEESDVYSGCYARVCINLFPFSHKGNRGIGCGLEAVQKICDGEPLCGVQVDVNEAFGDWNEGTGAVQAYPQPVQGQAVQPQAIPFQAPTGYPTGVQPAAPAPVQGYPQQIPQAPVRQGYPQQNGGCPVQVPVQAGTTAFQNSVAVAGSILPPQLFGEGQGSRVA